MRQAQLIAAPMPILSDTDGRVKQKLKNVRGHLLPVRKSTNRCTNRNNLPKPTTAPAFQSSRFCMWMLEPTRWAVIL